MKKDDVTSGNNSEATTLATLHSGTLTQIEYEIAEYIGAEGDEYSDNEKNAAFRIMVGFFKSGQIRPLMENEQ